MTLRAFYLSCPAEAELSPSCRVVMSSKSRWWRTNKCVFNYPPMLSSALTRHASVHAGNLSFRRHWSIMPHTISPSNWVCPPLLCKGDVRIWWGIRQWCFFFFESRCTRAEKRLQGVFVWIGNPEACRVKRGLTDPFKPMSILIPITVCTLSRVHGLSVISLAPLWLKKWQWDKLREQAETAPSFSSNCLVILYF